MPRLYPLILAVFVTAAALACPNAARSGEREIREYQGQALSPFKRGYDNSIQGPQKVDPVTYRFKISGLVENPLELTYAQVAALPQVSRVITLHCVEGWDERLLFEGVCLKDLFQKAKVKPEVTTVIFHAVDGYSSSLDYDFVVKKDLVLASKINGLLLDEERGFPFQIVAESKLGYKWVKWVTEIVLSDKPYKGYWERRGYDNEADVEK